MLPPAATAADANDEAAPVQGDKSGALGSWGAACGAEGGVLGLLASVILLAQPFGGAREGMAGDFRHDEAGLAAACAVDALARRY